MRKKRISVTRAAQRITRSISDVIHHLTDRHQDQHQERKSSTVVENRLTKATGGRSINVEQVDHLTRGRSKRMVAAVIEETETIRTTMTDVGLELKRMSDQLRGR